MRRPASVGAGRRRSVVKRSIQLTPAHSGRWSCRARRAHRRAVQAALAVARDTPCGRVATDLKVRAPFLYEAFSVLACVALAWHFRGGKDPPFGSHRATGRGVSPWRDGLSGQGAARSNRAVVGSNPTGGSAVSAPLLAFPRATFPSAGSRRIATFSSPFEEQVSGRLRLQARAASPSAAQSEDPGSCGGRRVAR